MGSTVRKHRKRRRARLRISLSACASARISMMCRSARTFPVKTIGASVSFGSSERAVCCPFFLMLEQEFGHLLVLGRGPVGPLLERPVQLIVFLVFGALHETKHGPA